MVYLVIFLPFYDNLLNFEIHLNKKPIIQHLKQSKQLEKTTLRNLKLSWFKNI